MAKTKSVFFCQECGAQSPKWAGRCHDCGAWNSMVEETVRKDAGFGRQNLGGEAPQLLSDVDVTTHKRWATGLPELDRVLGGGLLPSSLILLGGDPGIGKSTLLLQALNHLALAHHKVLYVTGEEAKAQVRLRAERLEATAPLWILAENSLEAILDHVEKLKPDVLVIDSIQTVYLSSIQSAPGSLSQVRECAGRLLTFTKSQACATWLVGHVNKEGAIAGPRVLEHMVDVVLGFEGEPKQNFRILRATKNRFGSTHEIGLFEMTQSGLVPVTQASALFLPEGHRRIPGSSIMASLEGMRPFLVEIQALVAGSQLINPRRTVLGVDANRVAILIAVLEKVMGLNLYGQDIYVTAAGGYKAVEPGGDLAILAALISSFRNQPTRGAEVFIGEVGLTGEIRPVQGFALRLAEVAQMGLKQVLCAKLPKGVERPEGLEIAQVKHVRELEGWF